MSRSVKDETKAILDKLSDFVEEEEKIRQTTIEKRIFLEKETYSLIENAKIQKTKIDNLGHAALIIYGEVRYFCLITDNYIESSIDFEVPDNKDIIIGIGILLIKQNCLNIKKEVTSLQIIDECLGLEGESNVNYIDIEADSILDSFYEEYYVYEIPEQYHNFLFQEDLARIFLYATLNNNLCLDKKTMENIKSLLLLESSRSILPAISNISVLSRRLHVFLEIYRCMEYLYIIIAVFEWQEKYDIPEYNLVDLVLGEKMRFPERVSIIELVTKYADIKVIDRYYSYIKRNSVSETEKEDEKKALQVAEYIYFQRCNIAHFKYKQDKFVIEEDISDQLELISELVLCIFDKLDKKIVSLCKKTSVWTELH